MTWSEGGGVSQESRRIPFEPFVRGHGNEALLETLVREWEEGGRPIALDTKLQIERGGRGVVKSPWILLTFATPSIRSRANLHPRETLNDLT